MRDRPTYGHMDGWTDIRTVGWTYGRTDTPSYRDARTHLKNSGPSPTNGRTDEDASKNKEENGYEIYITYQRIEVDEMKFCTIQQKRLSTPSF